MSFDPIKKEKVHEIIIKQIKENIEKGELLPGDKLPSERELAQSLSVSRGVVRQAMSVLEAKGIIEIKQGIGVFLIKNERESMLKKLHSIFSETDIHLIELLELRQCIEGQAAAYAAERRNERDLFKIKQALDKLEAAVDKGDVAADEDFQFHMAVAEASHNSMMVQTLRLLSDAFIKSLYKARSEALLIPGKSQSVVEEHYEIYEAIKNADPERARKALLLHLENTKNQGNELILKTEGKKV
jgi:GntR family transcriptional repressor for pyruvate dehydrogenase complex